MKKDLERIEEVSTVPCVLVERVDEVGFSEWKDAGKPRLLMKVAEAGEARLYEDVGYGHLFLVVGDEVFQGRDFVSTPDGEWVGLSEYFLPSAGLFRKA